MWAYEGITHDKGEAAERLGRIHSCWEQAQGQLCLPELKTEFVDTSRFVCRIWNKMHRIWLHFTCAGILNFIWKVMNNSGWGILLTNYFKELKQLTVSVSGQQIDITFFPKNFKFSFQFYRRKFSFPGKKSNHPVQCPHVESVFVCDVDAEKNTHIEDTDRSRSIFMWGDGGRKRQMVEVNEAMKPWTTSPIIHNFNSHSRLIIARNASYATTTESARDLVSARCA